MLFTGRRDVGLLIRIWVGGPSAGRAALRLLNPGTEDPSSPGMAITPTGVVAAGAEYDLSTAIIGSWASRGWDPLRFALSLEAFSVGPQTVGWLSVDQLGQGLPARHNNKAVNGAHAPYGDVRLAPITSGSAIIRPFDVTFV